MGPEYKFVINLLRFKIELQDNDAEENCDGIGEDECLLRRTLEAHTDYIYTQNNKHWKLYVNY